MEIYWTDDLVLELLKNKIGPNTDMSVISEFKDSKAILPSNALILSLVKEDNSLIELNPTTNLLDYIDYKTDKLDWRINSCQCNGTIFNLDEI